MQLNSKAGWFIQFMLCDGFQTIHSEADRNDMHLLRIAVVVAVNAA